MVSKAIARFTKEDPTFRVSFDADNSQTIMAGMGELHLQIYVERLLLEYGVETVTSPPRVNYKSVIICATRFQRRLLTTLSERRSRNRSSSTTCSTAASSASATSPPDSTSPRVRSRPK